MKPSNLNSESTEVADPLRPLKEWDLVFCITNLERVRSSTQFGFNNTSSEL